LEPKSSHGLTSGKDKDIGRQLQNFLLYQNQTTLTEWIFHNLALVRSLFQYKGRKHQLGDSLLYHDHKLKKYSL